MFIFCEKMEASSVENVPCETEASDRTEKARAIAVAFDRMRKSKGKDVRDRRKLRNNAGDQVQVSIENEALNDSDEKTENGTRKDEGETQIPQESATINVDREITSSANLHQSNTLLSHQVFK